MILCLFVFDYVQFNTAAVKQDNSVCFVILSLPQYSISIACIVAYIG